MNPFEELQPVVCISENFPYIAKYGGNGTDGKQVAFHPKKGEKLVITEVLGDFIRFDCYDTDASFNWWHYSRFAEIDEIQFAKEELEKEAMNYKRLKYERNKVTTDNKQ